MKVLLIASSEGTALAPLTDDRCPALLPIAGKPLIVHALESLTAAGLTEATVALSPHADKVREFLGDGARWGVALQYISTWPGERIPALADRVRSAGDAGDLLVLHGAVLRSPSIVRAVVETPLPSGDAHVAAAVAGHLAGADRIGPRARVAQLPADPGKPETWQTSGAVLDLPGSLSLIENLRSFHRANIQAAAGGVDGLVVPGLERSGGVRTGRQSTVPPSAVRGLHIFAGARVRVHPTAEIGSDVVLCDDVLVDKAATLVNTVVLSNTYVGEAVHLNDAIVSGGTLIRVDRDSVTHVTDQFLLADISRQPLARSAGSAASRAAGLITLLVSTPLWPLALAVALLARPRQPLRTVRLLGNREAPGSDGRLRAKSFASREFAVGAPLLRYLPRVWAVVTGDLSLVGVSPLSPVEAVARVNEWELVRDEAPSGLIGPSQLSGGDSADERYLLEAVYARTRTPWRDLVWLARGVLALAGPRAWRLAGGHV